jgi:hypothetical protein
MEEEKIYKFEMMEKEKIRYFMVNYMCIKNAKTVYGRNLLKITGVLNTSDLERQFAAANKVEKCIITNIYQMTKEDFEASTMEAKE